MCYERLRIRNRKAEDTVSLEYLTKIHNNYEKWIASISNANPSHVSIVDGNLSKYNVAREIEIIISSLMKDEEMEEDDNQEEFILVNKIKN